MILLNDDDLSYAIIRFDDRSIRTLTESIGDLDDSLARALCWSSVLDMVRQAELAMPTFVAMVAGGMAREPSIASLEILLDTCAGLLRTMADPAWVPHAYAQLAEAAPQLLLAAEPGSDHQLAWAQLLGWTATTPEQLDLISGLLTGSVVVPGLTMSSELKWSLLQRLAACGRAGDVEIEARLAEDGTDTGLRSAAACRAAVGDADHKAAAWELLAESADIAVSFMHAVATGFYQPEQADLLSSYTPRYFDILPQIWSSSGGHLRVARAGALFPITSAGPELIARIDEFLAAEPREPGLVRVLKEQRDVVSRALRSRALVG
jgi:aminopeptidase N